MTEERSRPNQRRGGRRFRYSRPKRSCECKKLNYKEVDTLRRFITETGKIRPRRQTGMCAKCQRRLAQTIKRSRHMALLPFAGETLH